ncbi:MAG: hypothetical protein JWM31_2645, partial [Solirubrobacterales bacterium]|nr:hypothetical protein [Solirubrobacterales bacterium]
MARLPTTSGPTADDARRAFGEAVPDPVAERRVPSPLGGALAPVGLVVLTLLLTGLGLWHAERGALRDPVQRGERGLVVGATGPSLLRAPNLDRALNAVAVRLRPGELVTDLSVSPIRAAVSVRDGVGHQRVLTVDLAYRVRSAGAGSSTSDGPALSRVDRAAPGRLVAAALRAGP